LTGTTKCILEFLRPTIRFGQRITRATKNSSAKRSIGKLFTEIPASDAIGKVEPMRDAEAVLRGAQATEDSKSLPRI